MPIYLHDGKLLIESNKLATSEQCCCAPPATGACCINGACDPTYTTQEECEACETVNNCTEYLFLEDPEEPCPEGWTPDGFGGCSRVTNPASCEECGGFCEPTQTGPCGDWIENTDCNATADCSETPTIYVCGIPATVDVPVDNTSPRPAPGTIETGFGEPWFFGGVDLQVIPGGGGFQSGYPGFAASLTNECGRWRLSIGPANHSNLCSLATISIVADLGSVDDQGCLPISGTGTLFWSTCRDCQTPCGFNLPGPSQISGSVPVSITISDSPCP